MKLRVDNFALIKHAEIDIEGITVIAGNNNSGKSTVGKVLFSIFSVLDNINHKIERQRYKIVVRTLISKLLQAEDEKDKKYVWELDGDFSNFMYSRQNKVIIDWDSFFLKYEKLLPKLKQAEVRQDIKYTIEQINSWHPSRLIMDAITPYFSACFNQQINSIATPDVPAKVLLKIKNKEISLSFEDNSVTEFKTEIELTNKAVFYNSPYVVDLMETHMLDNLPMRHLINMLRQYSARMVDDSDLFEKSLLKDRLSEVMKKIDAVLPGRILKQRTGYGLARPEWKEPLFVKNLSTGLKAFVVLKMLLESNQLKDRDILILDEPEIHLHPTWQLIYAELIVLLQKEFDLSVVITTHSHFFLNAIETYSRKYATFDKLNLYLAEVEEGGAIIQNVSNDSEKIYKKMAEAVATLRSERIELAE